MEVRDVAAAARAGVTPPSEHDHYPTGNRTLKVDPRLDMDPDRFTVDCSDNVHAQQMIGSVNRWRARCGDCGMVKHGWSRAEAIEAVKAGHR